MRIFNGTLVTHQFPRVGNPAPNAVEVIQGLQKNYGVKVILYTMRDDQHYFNPITGRVEPITSQLQAAGCKSCLKEAVDYCIRNGIMLYGVNKNPGQERWSYSRKVHADLYIDDAAAGFLFESMDLRKIVEAFEEFTKLYEIRFSQDRDISVQEEIQTRKRFLEGLKAYSRGEITDPIWIGF